MSSGFPASVRTLSAAYGMVTIINDLNIVYRDKKLKYILATKKKRIPSKTFYEKTGHVRKSSEIYQ